MSRQRGVIYRLRCGVPWQCDGKHHAWANWLSPGYTSCGDQLKDDELPHDKFLSLDSQERQGRGMFGSLKRTVNRSKTKTIFEYFFKYLFSKPHFVLFQHNVGGHAIEYYRWYKHMGRKLWKWWCTEFSFDACSEWCRRNRGIWCSAEYVEENPQFHCAHAAL